VRCEKDILRSARHVCKQFVAERCWTYSVSKIKLQATVLLEMMCVFNGRQSDLERDEICTFMPFRTSVMTFVLFLTK
jgi:hypothetical protein